MSTVNIAHFKDRAYVVQHRRRHDDINYYIPHGSVSLPLLYLHYKEAVRAAADTRKLLGLSRKDVLVLRVHVEMILRWP